MVDGLNGVSGLLKEETVKLGKEIALVQEDVEEALHAEDRALRKLVVKVTNDE